MGAIISWVVLCAAGVWASFYCLKRAKGRNWAHFLGWFIAWCFGVGMMFTFVGDALRWSAGWIGIGAAGLVIVFGLITLFDMLDKKPDAAALLGGLILPSVLAISLTQLYNFGRQVTGNFGDIKSTVQSSGR